MKKLLLVIAVLFGCYLYFSGQHSQALNNSPASATNSSLDESDAIIAKAFASRKSNLQVSGQGIVVKLLPDDNSGIRHQRFIIKLSTGQTVLVAHNIDLAARVDGLHEGDSIQFYGEYEWNEKGGVLHWTYRDPNGSHPSGWLKHNGQTYQ
jgi:hypothetical protein